MTQAVKNFINEHQALFWYSPGGKGETVSVSDDKETEKYCDAPINMLIIPQ
ncbi:MAG: hypothetical protein LBK07_10425 [Tannerella sp.]|jgi:hypothetical protein|nr:hypothetical protein [Tannerella sp.]